MLTQRLMAMATQVEEGESVADIGTDHGYLPMYLHKEGITSKVIMADVSKGSLKKARVNCSDICPNETFDFRLGNGLKVIERGEVDDIVIAGMGGVLITEILGKDIGKTKTFKKLILQPRTAQGRLRFWLVRKGFKIVKEQIVKEGRFICEVITAVPGEALEDMKLEEGPDAIQWEVPHWITEIEGPLTQEFLQRKLDRENRILTSMENSKTIKPSDIKVIKENIKYIESLMK